ncbi:MAG: endonuclease/exonuclease/phosphatase family protein [Pirellulaceae bacterium]
MAKWAERLLWLIKAAAIAVIAVSLFACAARWWWPCELACHFRVQYAVLLLAAGVALAVGRSWRWALVVLIAAGANASGFAGLYWPRVAAPSTAEAASDTAGVKGRGIKVMTFNVNGGNRNHAGIRELIERESPEIVVIVEYTPRLSAAFADWKAGYPYRHESPRDHAFGIAVFSRLVISNFREVSLGDSEAPTIVAEIDGGEDEESRSQLGGCTLIATHPVPPVGAERAAMRNGQLADLARLAAGQIPPTIVAGDLNITSFSPMFADLLREGRLLDSRRGFGNQATWPRQLPPLRMAIDHVLVTPGIEVVERRVAGFAGSDHAAVVAELRRASKRGH